MSLKELAACALNPANPSNNSPVLTLPAAWEMQPEEFPKALQSVFFDLCEAVNSDAAKTAYLQAYSDPAGELQMKPVN